SSIARRFRKDEAYKTALCDAFKKFGFCPYGEGCRFAHGDSELRLPAQVKNIVRQVFHFRTLPVWTSLPGLPLIQYERLLAAGQISPEREDEARAPQSRRSSGMSPNRSHRNRADAARRLTFERENSFTPRQKIPNAIYPKMEIINIERACKYADDIVEKSKLNFPIVFCINFSPIVSFYDYLYRDKFLR
ncbi:unnamed protein product, partial [Cylicostephanus goldi]